LGLSHFSPNNFVFFIGLFLLNFMYQNALPAVGLLIVMIGVAWLLQRYRRHLPGVAAQRGPRLQVMNSMSLGPHQRVVTVQVGEGESARCLVLGVAQGGITALHSLPLDAADAAGPPPGATASGAAGGFAARLAQIVQTRPQGPHAPR
jgi:flagellar protein FliO/FliZ